MKKTKKLDMWTVLSFVILLCYAVFLLYPMLNLLRQSVVITDVVTVAGTWGWPGKVDACVTEDNAPF